MPKVQGSKLKVEAARANFIREFSKRSSRECEEYRVVKEQKKMSG